MKVRYPFVVAFVVVVALAGAFVAYTVAARIYSRLSSAGAPAVSPVVAVVRPKVDASGEGAVVRPKVDASGEGAVVRPKVDAGGERSSPSALPSGVPFAGNADPVRIVSIQLSATSVRPGDNISGRVVTTSNAASVTAQVGTIVVPVPKTAPGIFSLTVQVPHTTFGLHGVDVIVTAIRTDGAKDQRTVSVSLE